MGFQPTAATQPDDECENCGAHLPPFGPDGTRTCSFCSRTYQRPITPPAAGPALGPSIIINPTFTAPSVDLDQVATAAKRTGGGCGIVTLVITVLVVGGIVLGVTRFSSQLSGFTDSIKKATASPDDLVGPAALLPGEPTKAPTTVLITRRSESGRSVYELRKVDAAAGKVVWSAPLPDGNTYTPIITNGPLFFVVNKSQITAIRDTDGSVAWQRNVSDEVQVTSCKTCFWVAGDRLVAQSGDGNLQVLDTATGAPAWNRMLASTQAQVVAFGDRVLISDGKPAEDDHLFVVSLADGTQQSDLQPSCAPQSRGGSREEFDVGALIVPVVAENAVVLGFGFGSACWQRVDLASGQVAWEAPSKDVTLSASQSVVVRGTDNHVAVSDSGNITLIDLGNGTVADMGGDSGQERVPLALTPDTLLIREKSSRGTTKYSIATLDPASAQARWKVDLGTASPAEGPGANTSTVSTGESRFTVSLAGDTVHVVTFRGDSKDFAVQNVALATGVAPGTSTVPANLTGRITIPDFRVVGWRDAQVTMIVENDLITLDTAKSAISSRWPT